MRGSHGLIVIHYVSILEIFSGSLKIVFYEVILLLIKVLEIPLSKFIQFSFKFT